MSDSISSTFGIKPVFTDLNVLKTAENNVRLYKQREYNVVQAARQIEGALNTLIDITYQRELLKVDMWSNTVNQTDGITDETTNLSGQLYSTVALKIEDHDLQSWFNIYCDENNNLSFSNRFGDTVFQDIEQSNLTKEIVKAYCDVLKYYCEERGEHQLYMDTISRLDLALGKPTIVTMGPPKPNNLP